jgi:hypothetical protein
MCDKTKKFDLAKKLQNVINTSSDTNIRKNIENIKQEYINEMLSIDISNVFDNVIFDINQEIKILAEFNVH